jgi:general secretion pathway protein C
MHARASTCLQKYSVSRHNGVVLNSSSFRPRIHALHFVLVTALFSSACRKVDTPASSEAAPEKNPSIPAGFVALELKNEPVGDVLQKLSAAAGKPVVIDPDAQSAALCARITLLTGGNMAVDNAIQLVREALDSSGLKIVESPTGGFIVRRNPDKPLPASCQEVPFPIMPSPESSASAEFNDKFSQGVRQISATEYELSRATVDLLLNDSTKLARTARVIPQMRDGQAVGMKLFGIRPRSPLASLGLQNGDAVTLVQGQPITTPDKALEIYAGLKTAKKIEVTIERKGQTMTIVYHLKEK